MIFAMNNLKMLVVWIVSIVFLFIKKLDAQTELKLKTDCNMQTKSHHYCVIWLIYTWGFSNKLEPSYIFLFFLMLYLYEAARASIIIPWKQMFLNSVNIRRDTL